MGESSALPRPRLSPLATQSLSLSFSCCMFACFNYTNYRRPVMLENPQLRLVATTGFFSIFIFRFSFFFFLLRLFFYFSKVDWVLAAVRKYLENPKWLLDRRGGERFSHDILKACIYHGTGFLKSPYSLSNTLRYNNTQCSLGFTICSISINQLFAQNYLCPLIIRFVRHNVSIAPICRALMT